MNMQKGNISVVISFIIVFCIIALAIYALLSGGKEPEMLQKPTVNDTEVTMEEDNSTQNKNMETDKRLLQNFTPIQEVSELQKTDLVVGTGDEVKAGATVSVHYTGAIASTGEVFQSSKDFGTDPITFPLGNVIKGWTDGIPGMKVGGTRRLVIPSSQAYGATPPPGSGIPANADLVFDVELIGIQ